MKFAPHVRDYMDKSFITFHPDDDVYKAIDIMLDKKILGAPVVDKKGKLIGVISEKDCLRTFTHGAYSLLPSGKVIDFMTKPVMTIGPDLDIFSVADIFLKQSFRRLPVVENGELVGQITRRDLLRVIQKLRRKK